MGVAVRFRDTLRAIVPWWLSDRPPANAPPGPSSLNVGFRILWGLIAPLDNAMQAIYEGVQAAWPGVGTSEALPLIGRTRGIVQGMTETPAHYAARLVPWLETHADGRTKQLANQLHEYLAGNPRVRIYTRAGACTTVDTDGTATVFNGSDWDWDSVSNPGRSGFWSDMWIIIQDPSVFAVRPGTLGALTGDDGYGLGLMIPHDVASVVRKIIADWKGAHSNIRAVVWCSDPTKFNPLFPLGLGGTWGEWGLPGSDPRVKGGRDLTTCRFLDFPDPNPGTP